MATVERVANPEDDPRVKAVFDDIRATRGSDFVNNLWRYLAFDPALLEEVWRDVKAVMCFVGGAYVLSPLAALACTALGAAVTAVRGFAWGARAGVFAFPLAQLATDPVEHVAASGLLMTLIGALFVIRRRGRASDAPWAMVFPTGGPAPRHPSQLYEAALEGIVLFLVLFVLATVFQARRWPGTISGTFLAGYGVARIVAEFFREPDAQLGFLWGGATMGQLLSLPMIAVGIGAILYARRRKPA